MSSDLFRLDLDELRPTYMAKHPIWVFCDLPADHPDHSHWGVDDRERVHPLDVPLPWTPDWGATLVVRARFTVADGDEVGGAVIVRRSSPRRVVGTDLMLKLNKSTFQRLSLWPPQPGRLEEARATLYGHLGKTPSQVFPLRFEVESGLLTERVVGTRAGFRLGAANAVDDVP